MPIQFPAQGFNPDPGARMQRTETNALINTGQELQNDANTLIGKANQQAFDQGNRKKAGEMFVGMGKQALELLAPFQDGDPEGVAAWGRLYPEVVSGLESLGIPTDKVSKPGTPLKQIRGELAELGEQGQIILSGMAQEPVTYGAPVKGGDGTYLRPESTGGMYDTGATAPAAGSSGGVTGSLQELNAINDDRVSRGEDPMQPEAYLKDRRRSSAAMQAYSQYVIDAQERGQKPMSEHEYSATRAGDIAGSTTESKGEATRIQGLINQGQEVADGLPVLRRTLELLDVVNTGGVITEFQLELAKKLGVETANQGELSANLGKAVLSQLRETFGAQFTQEEGNRLIAIEAGFGKNNATNARLLGQAIAIVEAKAKRAIKLSRNNDDEVTAQIIEEMMEMSLSPSEGDDEERLKKLGF